YQTGALREFLRVRGAELQHVKAHGILYDMMEKDPALAAAAGEAVLESGGRELIMVALAAGGCDSACRGRGLRVASEGFADRAYNADGTLVSRAQPGSLIDDPDRAAAQAVRLATDGRVRTIEGGELSLAVQTICCHGDTPGAPRIVRAVREALEKAGCRIRAMRAFVPIP
ncbi:MAG: LamB/YcsF family protein, partial [Betaproteobacteria bacterium]